MTKKLLILIFAVFYIVHTVAQIPGYLPTNGLVAWYPFNGNANDESGNGNNGTVNGCILTTDRFNNTSSSYQFNGTNNYIGINSSPSLETDYFTVSVWYNTNSNSLNQCLFGKSDISNFQLIKYQGWIDLIAIPIYQSCTTFQGWNYTYLPQILTPNQWQHVVYTWDGQKLKAYQNGILVNENNSIPPGPLAPCPGGSLRFGMWWNTDPSWFSGKMDDVGIWNRALTAQEVQQIYQINVTQPNNTLHFDGINDFVSVPYNSSFSLTNFTVEAWTKTTTTSAIGRILTKPVGGGQNYSLLIINGFPHVRFDNGITFVQAQGNNLVNDGLWHHLAGVYDQPGGTLKLFVDGNLATTTATALIPLTSGEALYLGKFSASFNEYYQGSTDEVRIWNRALTLQEIQANFNCELTGNESGLIAYYNFNQGIPNSNNAGITNLNDQTPNHLNGTLQYFALNGNTSNWISPSAFASGSNCILIANICPGNNISLTIPSFGTGYNYQWQLDTGTGFADITDNSFYSGANTNIISITAAPSSWYGYKYRCKAVSGSNTVYGNEWTLKFKTTWSGTTSSAWEVGSNWTCNTVPDQYTDIFINTGVSNSPVLNSNRQCRSLNLSNGSVFTVTSGFILDVKGK